MPPVPAADGRALLVEQLDLRSACARCTGLCCVGLHLVRSADFAIDKPAGTPCPNLLDDFGCGIHSRLRESGFPGCVAYDCLGAGQRVTDYVDGGEWDADVPQNIAPVLGPFIEGKYRVRRRHYQSEVRSDQTAL